MPRPLFVREETKQRLGKSVKVVEGRSSAEVVVAVDPWSSTWTGVDYAVGAALAYAVLLYTLFSPHVFGLVWIAALMPASFVLGVYGLRVMPRVRMRLAGPGKVRTMVERSARARFMELQVFATRERSGLLVYVSLAESQCVVVADVGVHARVGESAWAKAAGAVEAAIVHNGTGEVGCKALCEAIEALAPVLEGPLPRRDDDEDELEDVA